MRICHFKFWVIVVQLLHVSPSPPLKFILQIVLNYKWGLCGSLFNKSLSVCKWRAIYNSYEEKVLNQYNKSSSQVQMFGYIPKFWFDWDMHPLFPWSPLGGLDLPRERYLISTSVTQKLNLPRFLAYDLCIFQLQYLCLIKFSPPPLSPPKTCFLHWGPLLLSCLRLLCFPIANWREPPSLTACVDHGVEERLGLSKEMVGEIGKVLHDHNTQ